MTVIAAFEVHDSPLLFGDLLRTGPTSGGKAAVPAQGEVHDFFGEGWGITGLGQKVCLLSDSFAIAWAGDWLGARVAIAELRSRAQSGPISANDAREYLASEPDLKRYPASFIGLTHVDGRVQKFHFDADEFYSPTLGLTYVSGSGKGAIRDFARLLRSCEIADFGEANSSDRALATALTLGGMLLNGELRGREAATSLRNFFGGGYEIAYFSEGRMRKSPDITYFLWTARVDNGQIRLAYPELLVKQTYSNDHLLIRSARIVSSEANPTPRIVDEQGHVVGPMYEAPAFSNLETLQSMSLQSRVLCHCVEVHRKKTVVGLQTSVHRYGTDSEVPVQFEDTGGELRMGIREDAARAILDALKHYQT